MRFGLFSAARAEMGEQASDSQIYTDNVDSICEAESLGFHSVFLVEHHFTGFGQISATLNFLTYLAAKTSRMRLGTAVLVLPCHNPALLAERAATLDLLSNGRLDLGIGKATGGASSTASASRWRRRASVTTRRWLFCAGLGRARPAFRFMASYGISRTSSSRQRQSGSRIRPYGLAPSARFDPPCGGERLQPVTRPKWQS